MPAVVFDLRALIAEQPQEIALHAINVLTSNRATLKASAPRVSTHIWRILKHWLDRSYYYRRILKLDTYTQREFEIAAIILSYSVANCDRWTGISLARQGKSTAPYIDHYQKASN